MEREYILDGDNFIAATDEVGRGPLAGPVVGGCVLVRGDLKKLEQLTAYLKDLGVTDSKKLTDKKRERILHELDIDYSKSKKWSLPYEGLCVELSICEKAPKVIDDINILQASLLSMKSSFDRCRTLDDTQGAVLVDGNKVFSSKSFRIYSIVKGDSKSALIGLASIIAKVYRDKLMQKYSLQYPYYSFEKNAGYPTVAHRKAIEKFGITPIHRKTFKGVKEYLDGEFV